MKKVKLNLAQISDSAKTLNNKSLTTIKGGLGDPPPFGRMGDPPPFGRG
ncbi:MAG: hypothetical protein AB8F74_04720 [Saprospiraceae bacterium]